jgi:hypothetical protein
LAKRTRGSRSAHRPGGHAPTRPSPARPGSTSAPATRATPGASGTSQLDAAVAIADDIEARRPAEAAAQLSRASRATPGRAKVKPNSLLAARAAEEYLYIGADLRRIAMVDAGVFGVLIVLWLLLVVLNLSGLY